jgi:tetratricopeptide (TPR) repeat protein
MAVHRKRKRPLPREPISGKRPRRRVLILSALIFGGLGFLTSAHAQEGGSGVLGAGVSSFSAGKYDTTVRQMTAVLQGDKVSPNEAAKALFFRGLAYQKLGQSTRAIADLGAAIWLGLSPPERTAALVNRSLAYRATGLKTQADAELASARKDDNNGQVDKLLASNGGTGADTASMGAFATEVRTDDGRRSTIASASQEKPGFGTVTSSAQTPTRTADAASPSSWTTIAPEAAPSPSSGNRLTRWWGSIRGSTNDSAPPPTPAPSTKPPVVSSAWTTQTQTESSAAGPAPGTRIATASLTDPMPSAGGGNYRLQLSPTRSEAEAKELWQKVAKQNQQLAGLEPRIEKTDMGNLGTFYRLQIGPFPDKAESLKLCNALKRSGVDCFLVNP